MPYISTDKRYDVGFRVHDAMDGKAFNDPHISFKLPEFSGELNYVITRIIKQYLREEENYTAYNEIVGVLECVKQEFWRRTVVPYEEQKRFDNGDV